MVGNITFLACYKLLQLSGGPLHVSEMSEMYIGGQVSLRTTLRQDHVTSIVLKNDFLAECFKHLQENKR